MEFKVDYENGGNRDHLDQVSFLCKLAQAYEEKDDWGSRLRVCIVPVFAQYMDNVVMCLAVAFRLDLLLPQVNRYRAKAAE